MVMAAAPAPSSGRLTNYVLRAGGRRGSHFWPIYGEHGVVVLGGRGLDISVELMDFRNICVLGEMVNSDCLFLV
jgi:hypothetical protein